MWGKQFWIVTVLSLQELKSQASAGKLLHCYNDKKADAFRVIRMISESGRTGLQVLRCNVSDKWRYVSLLVPLSQRRRVPAGRKWVELSEWGKRKEKDREGGRDGEKEGGESGSYWADKALAITSIVTNHLKQVFFYILGLFFFFFFGELPSGFVFILLGIFDRQVEEGFLASSGQLNGLFCGLAWLTVAYWWTAKTLKKH